MFLSQRYIILFGIVLVFLITPKAAKAATLYWVGGNGDSVTTTAADWSTSDPASCNDNGGDAGAVPGASDVTVFDADCDNNATITANWSVAGLIINSGYSGTVTQNTTITLTVGSSGFTQAGGTFAGGDAAIDINGSWALSGGIFTSTSATMTILNNFTVTNSPTFTANGGTITFDGSANNQSSLSCGNVTFSTVAFSKSSLNGTEITVASNCIIPLGNSPTTYGQITNSGTFNIGTGTWTSTAGSYIQSSGGATTFTGTTIDFNSGASLLINGGSFTDNNLTTMTLEGSLTNTGNVLIDGIALTLDGGANTPGTINCGTVTWGSVTISKSSTNGSDITISSGCTLPIGNSPTTAGTILNSGVITIGTGTWTSNIGSYTQNSGGTLTFTGTTIDFNGDYDFVLNSSSTFTANSLTTFNIEGGLTTGSVFPTGVSLTVNGGQNTSGTITCGSTVFSTITIAKTHTNGTETTFSGNCTSSGAFTRNAGVINNSGSANSIFVGGDFSMSATDAFGGANLTIELNGTGAQTISQNAANPFSSPLRINKSSGTASLATNLSSASTLNVAQGTFSNGASFNLSIGASTIGASGIWSNAGTGDITLSGNVSNSGTVSFDGSGGGCGTSDAITIASSSASSQRTWSGSGTFTIFDVRVSDMAGSVIARNSTNVSNNTWTFSLFCTDLTQEDYRWFLNNNSTSPGAALASENTSITSNNTTPARLRINIGVDGGEDIGVSARQFKLQISTDTSGPWVDVDPDWWNSSWLNRRQITFDNSASAINLTDFPVLVALDSDNIDYSKTQNSGQDVRFVDSDGAALSYEIEKWDEAGTSYVWVSVPQIDAGSNSDYIWIYYNNTGASDGQSAAGAWNSNFVGVYHLPNGTTLAANDSTSNANNAVISSVTATTGQINGGGNFTGGTNYLRVPDAASQRPSTNITLSVWIKLNTFTDQSLIGKETGAGTSNAYVMWFQSGNLNFYTDPGPVLTYPSSNFSTGVWYHVTGVKSGTTGILYVNGAQVATRSDFPASITYSGTHSTFIGNDDNNNNEVPDYGALNGVADEFRLSSAARPADWVEAEYLTEVQAMNTYGVEETYGINSSFEDSAGVADGASLSSALLSTSDAYQSYEEANPTILNPDSFSLGELAEWDFSLDPTGLSDLTTYYFRLVNANGTVLDTYNNYPTLEIRNNTIPDLPSDLGPDDLVDGSSTNNPTPTLTFDLSDLDGSDTVQYRIQIDDTADFSSPLVDYTSALDSQGDANFTVSQPVGSGTYTVGNEGQTLTDGSYYWRVEAIDDSAAESGYATANSGLVAFVIDRTSSGGSGGGHSGQFTKIIIEPISDLFDFITGDDEPSEESDGENEDPIPSNPPSGSDPSPESGGGSESSSSSSTPDFRNVVTIFEFMNEVLENAIDLGREVSLPLLTVGLLLGSLANIAQITFIPGGVSELNVIHRLSMIHRLNLFGILLGYKKKKQSWGTVYDSFTKQPLDPVVVTLFDRFGKELTSALTDLDGRYGFLVKPGEYKIVAEKTNYTFPSSRLYGQNKDVIYENLYFGETFSIEQNKPIVIKDIPLDPKIADWNEIEKAKQGLTYFYSKHDVLIRRISNIIVTAGFIWATLSVIGSPTTYNILILAGYALFFVLNIIAKPQYYGKVVGKNGEPRRSAVVRVFQAATNMEVRHTVTDDFGRYFCLVPNGDYYVKIEKNLESIPGDLAFKSQLVSVKGGVLKQVFKI